MHRGDSSYVSLILVYCALNFHWELIPNKVHVIVGYLYSCICEARVTSTLNERLAGNTLLPNSNVINIFNGIILDFYMALATYAFCTST